MSTTFRCYLCDKMNPKAHASTLVCDRCWKVHRLTSNALEHRVASMHPDKGEETLLIDDALKATGPKPPDYWWLRTLP